MRPMLRPGLTLAWVSPDSLHLGAGGPDAVVVGGVPGCARAVIALMDGTRTVDQLLEQADAGDRDRLRTFIDRLDTANALIDAGRWPGGKDTSAARRERLLPDLLAAAPRDPDRWWAALGRVHVSVVGASRLGATTARALAEGGIGRVSVDDPRPVSHADVSLGGFSVDDVGSVRSELLRSHPGPPSTPLARAAERSLVVLTDAIDVETHARELTARRVPYLVVTCRERLGTVGPLHVPGLSACHFCVQLHRRDLDPAWPDVWRQQAWEASPIASGGAAALTAHVAALHVTAWAVGDQVPSMLGITEIDGTAPRPSSHWPMRPHPECGCAWASMAG